MTGCGGRRGTTLLELVVGTAIGLLVLGACVGGVSAAARLVRALGARAELEDTAQLAIEAFRFDARRAGWDPASIGLDGLAAAQSDQLELHADLDADGMLDGSSEEVTRWVCATGPPRLSRIIGAQSLPVAAPVTRCALRYLDGAGGELVAGTTGLDPLDRRRVRLVQLAVAVAPPGLGAVAERVAEVALGGRP